MEDIVKRLRTERYNVVKQLEKCQELQGRAKGKVAIGKLERAYTFLAARSLRLATCIDIMQGKAFTVHDIDGELTVVKPTESTARLLDLAEKLGGKVSEFRKEEHDGI